MLNSLKGKFQQVQDGISASIRGLKIKEDRTEPEISSVNFNAGAGIILQNEINHSEIHSLFEVNAQKAEIVDQKIYQVHAKLETQLWNMQEINNFILFIPEFTKKVESISKDLDSLRSMIVEAEEFLFQFEDLVESEEMKQKEINERFNLAAYIQKKSSNVDLVKQKLAEQYSEKMSQKEKKTRETLKERQELFNMAFQEDMQLYKESGKVPNIRIKDANSIMSLEDVVIEDDMKGLNELLDS